MLLFAVLACSSPTPVGAPVGAPAEAIVARPTAEWVEEERDKTAARLEKTEGGQLLAEAIEAHGGLTPWLQAGTLAFDFDYAPLDDPAKRRYSRSRVDLRSRRAVQHELGDGADAALGWDGTTAWITPSPDAFPSDPRFWAMTPFYFVGIPWVLADQGANAERLPDTVVPGAAVEGPLPTLKITYADGTGDAPDDFYVLHLHPTTKEVLALRYIVTFPAFFPDGGHSPEKLMIWSDLVEVDGLRFATHYSSHAWNDGAPGPQNTRVEVANLVVGDPIPEADFSE